MTLPRSLRADWASLAREYISNGEDRETARAKASCELADYLYYAESETIMPDPHADHVPSVACPADGRVHVCRVVDSYQSGPDRADISLVHEHYVQADCADVTNPDAACICDDPFSTTTTEIDEELPL